MQRGEKRIRSPRRAPPTPSAPGWAPELQKAKVYEQILLDIILRKGASRRAAGRAGLWWRRYGCAGLAGCATRSGELALEGLVVGRPRAGTAVAALDLVDVRQAFEARRLIEPHCAALAASHATPSDIADLHQRLRRRGPPPPPPPFGALVGMDQQFHAAVGSELRATRPWLIS